MIPKTLIIGAALSAVFIVAALLSFLWTPFDHTQLAIANKLKTPSLTHWFGTDHFGRDILARFWTRSSCAPTTSYSPSQAS